MTERVDAIVVGAGIAGLAAAAELARDRTVLVLEMEATHATHSTARSAASWIAGYGRPAVTPLTLASRAWFASGGDGHVERSLLSPRGLLLVSREPRAAKVAEAVSKGARPLTPDEARDYVEVLDSGAIAEAAWEPESFEIDVAGAVEALRAALVARGGRLRTRAGISAIARERGTWRIVAADGPVEAPLLVDAAGAWADQVATMAGLAPIGLQPYRRTACTFAAPPDVSTEDWPLLMDAAERFYMKPEGGGLLASPADETPSEPMDARPRMDDVARALELVGEFTTMAVRSVRSSWAGLRTFAPDRAPVMGPDPRAEGFVWSAGYGGTGVMVAPAAGRVVAALADGRPLPADVTAAGGHPADVLPDRLR